MIRTASSCRFCIFTLGAIALGNARGETIGPYEIEATPTAAVLLSGGGASFNWLNVVNNPVSLDQALTGFSVIDDGYGNAQSGTTLRITFAPGVLRNQSGPDLVLLDAGNDLNVYRVKTSYDGFTQEILVNASTDTGVDRSYFFGGAGPTTFDVLGATIDLSALNVPNGEFVHQVQLFTEGPSNDPLALGAIVAGESVPTLSPWGLSAMILLLLAAGTRVLGLTSGRRA